MRPLPAKLGLAAVLAALLVGSTAWATPYPGYDMWISAGGDSLYLSSLTEDVDYSYTPTADGYGGVYVLLHPITDLEGLYDITAWSSEFDIDPFVTNNLTVTNPSGSTQNYLFTVTSPVAPPLGSTTMDGSIGITVTSTPTAVTLSSVSPNAIYTAKLDGASVQTLFNHPSSVTCAVPGPFCSGTANAAFGPVAGPGVTTNMGIDIRFSLSPGDSATITSVFNIVPEPGTLALLALGLLPLVVQRRRAN